MKKYLSLAFFILLSALFCSCSDLYDPQRDSNIPWGSVKTFGIYCENIPVAVKWDNDTKMDIWYDAGAAMTVQDMVSGAAEGSKYWKLTGVSNWMGMGIRANPLSETRDLTAFDGGQIHFWYKGTKGFQIGIQSCSNSDVQKAWVPSSLMMYYGLKTNDTWSEVSVPISAFVYNNPLINLSYMQQYFMWMANASFGYVTGDVHSIDGIYWSKDYYGPAADHYTPTNFGLYSDSVESSVSWDDNCKLDIWADYYAAMQLTNIQTGAFEGANCWQLTGTGDWMAMSIRYNPDTAFNDMSYYALGALHFSVKGTNWFKVGIKSGIASPAEAWITTNQLSAMGYVPDGNWHEMIIPLTNFTGINFNEISQYFMFVCDANLGYNTNIVFYLDHIYWCLTN